jgi:hypothetical protein
MSDLTETVLRETFHRQADRLDPSARRRVLAVDYRPRTRRIRLIPALSAAGLVGAAAALALILTLGATPTPAFAGWTPTPTLASPGQTAAAIARCGLGGPVLIDTRGPFTVAVYAHPKPQSVPGLPTQTSSPAQPPVRPSFGSCFIGRHVSASATVGRPLAPVRAGQIQATEQTVSGGDQYATMLDGRVGRGVSAVQIELSNGRRVTATVSHGWYLVWWPGRPHGSAVAITTRGRVQTFPLPASAEVGAGSSCQACASSGPAMTVGG